MHRDGVLIDRSIAIVVHSVALAERRIVRSIWSTTPLDTIDLPLETIDLPFNSAD